MDLVAKESVPVRSAGGMPGGTGVAVSSLVGRSAVIEELRLTAARVALCDAKVLITGESGVGKDLVVRDIHAQSARCHRSLVAINCAGLSEALLESELFGHVKGSFTGAYRDKVGKLQLAHRGTVFLDEIGEMTLRMQALLLRFLENGEIQPVGADSAAARVDVRVIAATNRDLTEMVSTGKFREDLLYRIKVVHIHVPPLRERREDVKPLINHVLARNDARLRFSAEAWNALERYSWPGNVRELQNVVEQLIWMKGEGEIMLADLPAAIQGADRPRVAPTKERRRQVADALFTELVAGQYRFWDHVYPLFLRRDITRHDLRGLVRRGLTATRGSYRALLSLFGMPEEDYKRFLNFLGAHKCAVDFREFRGGTSDDVFPLPGPVAPHDEEES